MNIHKVYKLNETLQKDIEDCEDLSICEIYANQVDSIIKRLKWAKQIFIFFNLESRNRIYLYVLL